MPVLVWTLMIYLFLGASFLGWGLLILWRDLRRQSEVLAGQQHHPIVLQWQVDGELAAGQHQVTFYPDSLKSGTYLCKLNADEMTETRQMVFQGSASH